VSEAASSAAQFEAHSQAARAAFPGPGYQQWLSWLHERLHPQYYCEIGIASGKTLGLARPETCVIGVDPNFNIVEPLPAWSKLFRLPSDEFFQAGHASATLGENQVDLSFIDGLHTFDQALRDFVNLERHSKPGSLIAFHDILPFCEEVATRRRQTRFWTGDTFKVLLVLASVRPDLRLAVVPCYPSGLGIVTGLDPRNTVPPTEYANALETWQKVGFSDAFAKMQQSVATLPNDFALVAQYLG
jgi:hypothetical protein